MTNTAIPESALKAAYGAALLLPITNSEVEQILAAAAPHLMAQAWDEGYDEAEHEPIYDHAPTNPYH